MCTYVCDYMRKQLRNFRLLPEIDLTGNCEGMCGMWSVIRAFVLIPRKQQQAILLLPLFASLLPIDGHVPSDQNTSKWHIMTIPWGNLTEPTRVEVGPDGHISAAVLNAKAAESRDLRCASWTLPVQQNAAVLLKHVDWNQHHHMVEGYYIYKLL